MTATQDRRILFLDGLRIFAFLSVLAGHEYYDVLAAVAADASVHATLRFLVSLVLPLIQNGGAGVVVFFLVSGYIITHVLQTEGSAQFLVKRAFRIYPLYVTALLIHSAVLLITGKGVALSVFVPQLLLIGDLFGTPYALAGVEWALRVEVAFYLAMAAVFHFRSLPRFRAALPYVLLAGVLLAVAVGPIPGGEVKAKGYLTIYFPFLLLGAGVYLLEKKEASRSFVLVLGALVLLQYFVMIARHQPAWLGHHFAALAVGLFAGAWALRTRFKPAPWLRFTSDLTFSVYLFHVWFLDYATKALTMAGVGKTAAMTLALAALLVTCYAAVRWVEKPSNRLGAAIASRRAPPAEVTPRAPA